MCPKTLIYVKKSTKNPPRGHPNERFSSILDDLLGPFWYDYVVKAENHEIDDPYNVLERFCIPKPLIFLSIFQRFFVFFSEPLPESTFGAQNTDLC